MNTRYVLFLTLMLTFSAAAQRPGEGEASAASKAEKISRKTALPITPNRTLPKVNPPRTELEFSASPTTHEIFRARVFEEPLVPIGGEPSAEENAALAAALLGYAKRSGPDDFASLTGFLETHLHSPWRAAVLTDLGLEYYNTAHYSLALEAWEKAWSLAKDATDGKGKAIADRAAGELASMYGRLGRMTELEALLKSVEGRTFVGAATDRITDAREGLWNMQNKPEISFKCGPYALQQILLSDQKFLTSSPTNAGTEIANAASTQKGLSLPQVAELSKKIGLNYHMASRLPLTPSLFPTRSVKALRGGESDGERVSAGQMRGDFIIPSVVHWKVGHYAAMVRQEGDRFLLEDPTFGNTVWATRQVLEAETSGYFLIPPGELPRGWRTVDAKEGAAVWGKGVPPGSPPPPPPPCPDGEGSTGGGDTCSPPCPGQGAGGPPMARSTVDLSTVTLSLHDEPVGYSPPVGAPVRFWVRYNHRDPFQPGNFTYSNFGSKWACDWISYIMDNPQSLSANVTYYARGGGTRAFTGFNSGTQTFAPQQSDQTRLTRTGPASYERHSGDGSKLIFSQSDGSIGTSRKIFLTQIVDPFGNSVTLSYDVNLRLAGITDAIGQVTTLTYGNPSDIYKITRVTDPFGRFADFAYDSLGRLTNITDIIGLNSTFVYTGSGDFITSLVTPYGTNTFIAAQGGGPHGSTRSLESVYADGSRDRVEYNQSDNLGIPTNDPPAIVPTGMATFNAFLQGRNTYYWSRTACASGDGDYTKAKIYHWLHSENVAVASGILESTKEALENRVWFNYPGQIGGSGTVGTSSRPTKVGRVLDDGTTQLYTYAYDGFGHVTNSIDPLGRTFSYVYAANGIDLLEVRQTRAGNNELLSRMTYNAQHLPLTTVDAAGQTNTFTYNARGQLLTETNPKGETTTNTYDTNGYLVTVDGRLPGTNDVVTATYDAFGRMLTKTDESGYTLAFEHDAMDRLTKITHPDSSFAQFTYDRLDMVTFRDRAGRQTHFEFDNVRQMKKRTDPLGRVTLFDWCRCGSIKSLTDPMGRTTSWLTDVQGRHIGKQYGDGSQVKYVYENTSGRLRQVIDEKQQITVYTYNLDNTLKAVAYANTPVPTPGVNYTYDPNYQRRLSMTDGTGTTLYSYNPVTTTPTLGANQLASIDGPLPNDTISYAYNELGRRVSTAINGVASIMAYDAAGRVVSETNALGGFAYVYDGSSGRILTKTLPNGQIEERRYGNNLQDRRLQRITHRVGTTPISEFLYGRDLQADRITTWSQQVGEQSPRLHTFGYDSADQLLSTTVTNSGNLINSFAYGYDPLGNRLTEQVGATNYTATYNALNQISTSTVPGSSRTNEWDANDRLVAVNAGNRRTEFTYDGLSRMVAIRQLTNGSEASIRRFVWCGNAPCEERDAVGAVTKRFFVHGTKVESGPSAGSYFYTRDHLGSVRELTDGSGIVRARYDYDPYGRRTRLMGDVAADFGFTGMFFATEASLSVTPFRTYDPELGRWLSRDPLGDAEVQEGPNLYAYVRNNPINATDPLGLCCEAEKAALQDMMKDADKQCGAALDNAHRKCAEVQKQLGEQQANPTCVLLFELAHDTCDAAVAGVDAAIQALVVCALQPCDPKSCTKPKRCGFPDWLGMFGPLPIQFGYTVGRAASGGGPCQP
jgi:RHS repeat-associated protein